jgi:hypothetical protein
MKRIQLLCIFLSLAVIANATNAAVVTAYSNRSVFNADAGGPVTIEDFTDSFHYPITTGVLNSTTNLVVSAGTPINPGDIKPGVTYSVATAGRTGLFFNIDAGVFFGGFLDGLTNGPNAALTATFDGPVKAFGFDTNQFMGHGFALDIAFNSGPDFLQGYAVAPSNASQFFGFISDIQDITSVRVTGSNVTFDFAVDNFTFTQPLVSTAAPEPTVLAFAIVAGPVWLAGQWIARRRDPMFQTLFSSRKK